MEMTRLGVVETRFANLVWTNAPMRTRELVELCQQELNWKRTTTYTVLKKMCERGIFSLDDKIVTVKIPKDEFHAIQSEQFVSTNFEGSLPAFLAAFTSCQKITQKELSQIRQMLDSYEEA